MIEYITKIRTEVGDLPVDFNSLYNLPKFDTTLTQSGSFADAKATGDKINQISSELTSQSNVLSALNASTTKSINGIKPDNNGNVVLNASKVGALPDTYVSVTSIGKQTGDVELSGGAGISVSGTEITNSGVISVTTGSSNGTIKVNTNGQSSNVAVKGLGSAAYTDSDQYMPKFTFSLSGTTLTITTT